MLASAVMYHECQKNIQRSDLGKTWVVKQIGMGWAGERTETQQNWRLHWKYDCLSALFCFRGAYRARLYDIVIVVMNYKAMTRPVAET
jgi:hypothetical protein